MSEFTPTPRTQVRRLPDRGHYDSETVYRILDEGFLCHVGFLVDGQPFVIPTGYARVDDSIYLHGSAASRMLRTLAGGVQVCVTVTLVDGLVLARSAFHHSMNYRSVVILGRPCRRGSRGKIAGALGVHKSCRAGAMGCGAAGARFRIEGDFGVEDFVAGSFGENSHWAAEG